MSTLKADEIARHAYQAGFRGEALTTAVAVALAESGGNTRAHNGTPPDNSYGLWQINMLGSMGPARRHQFHLDSDKELFDPDENAKAAFAISSHGKSFGPWSTYTNGAYKKHLAEARKAAHKASEHHGKGHSGGKDAAKHGHGKGGKTGHGDGFKVDPDQFHGYTKKVDHVAGELRQIGSRTVHGVTGIAKDSFGQVGRETGFSDALGDFSRSLEKQVTAIGKNAQELGALTRKAGTTYQVREAETVQDFRAVDIKSVLG
ncbi:MAG TPA: transglycosylase SLT domain-containing protein [Amycolatopsis sp.]|uniref:transglycosylase SLT domain-containing protein n=1 Tax=Amycolatopsis sp. TaxID=37632 RepID=UPI002B460556|nr:transglycosylase SLT domain-containing protein [Amycolatopsis sp.]HKS45697.1 transglycosylase SLT domain-containing protein [Amycolatopsis sp.]